MLVADHGERSNVYFICPMEAYIERATLMLFIRLPVTVRRRHPEYAEALKCNAKRLVTLFDFHHTLLHLLHLQAKAPQEQDAFALVLEDRSSLFHSVAGGRGGCGALHIAPEVCACNTTPDDSDSRPLGVLLVGNNKLMPAVRNALNRAVKEGDYKKLYAGWRTDSDSLLSSHFLSNASRTADVFLQFKVLHSRQASRSRFASITSRSKMCLRR